MFWCSLPNLPKEILQSLIQRRLLLQVCLIFIRISSLSINSNSIVRQQVSFAFLFSFFVSMYFLWNFEYSVSWEFQQIFTLHCTFHHSWTCVLFCKYVCSFKFIARCVLSVHPGHAFLTHTHHVLYNSHAEELYYTPIVCVQTWQIL